MAAPGEAWDRKDNFAVSVRVILPIGLTPNHTTGGRRWTVERATPRSVCKAAIGVEDPLELDRT